MSFLLGYIDYKVSNIIKFVFSLDLPTKNTFQTGKESPRAERS